MKTDAKTEPNKRQAMVLQTAVDDIEAVITVNQLKTGAFRLTGYLRNKKTDERIWTVPSKMMKVDAESQIKDKAKALVDRLSKDLKGSNKQSALTAQGSVYRTAFQEMKDANLFHNSAWNKDTLRNRMVYLERRVLPHLDAVREAEGDVTAEDMLLLMKKLESEALASGHSNKKSAQVATNLSSKLAGCNFLLDQMMNLHPELSAARFPTAVQTRAPQNEQLKYLSDETRVKIAEQLVNCSEPVVFGVALLFFCGLRPAEAAAITLEDIVDHEAYLEIVVRSQIKNGKRTDALKTGNGYRYVIGPYILRCILEKLKGRLRQDGYTEDEIRTMALSHKEGDLHAFAEGAAISALGRKLLLSCGLKKSDLQDVEQDMNDGGASGEVDASAYVMRRDFVTRASNCCGISPMVVDYIIGHSREDGIKPDLTVEENQRELARRLENYIFLEAYSLHPFFKPVVPTGLSTSVASTTAAKIRLPEAALVKISILSDEPDVPISISGDAGLQRNTASAPNSEKHRIGQIVIQPSRKVTKRQKSCCIVFDASNYDRMGDIGWYAVDLGEVMKAYERKN